jgi:hypothetical protein
VGGIPYRWDHWSDGGGRIHSIVAAGKVASYEAVYTQTEPPAEESPSVGKIPPAPRTTLERHPPKSTRSRIARFVFDSDESGSHFLCKLDSKPYRACKSPLVYRQLKRGRHRLSIYAINASGNRDQTPVSFAWKVLPKG